MPNSLKVTRHHTPDAQQTVINAQTPGGVECHVIGGLTKLEQAAISIAAELAAFGDKVSAENIVTFAEQILAECKRRENPSPVEPDPT